MVFCAQGGVVLVFFLLCFFVLCVFSSCVSFDGIGCVCDKRLIFFFLAIVFADSDFIEE